MSILNNVSVPAIPWISYTVKEWIKDSFNFVQEEGEMKWFMDLERAMTLVI